MWKKLYYVKNKIGESYLVYSPTKGWVTKPYLKKEVLSEGVEGFSTNSKGLRGEDEYTYKKPNSVTRILVLGDSQTFGYEASDNGTYSHQLENMLPNSQVINFGGNGYGHDQMLISFEEEGIKYNPDIVIVGFVAEDMERNLLAFRSYAKPIFRFLNGKLVLENYPVPTPERTINREKYRLRIIDFMEILYAGFRKKTGMQDKDERLITEAIFDEIINVAKSINAKPIFVYLPSGKELLNTNSEMNAREVFLSNYCIRSGVHYMSTRPFFIPFVKKGVMFETVKHYGDREHLVIAVAIKDYLNKIIK
jgi:hypothetical protein